MEEGNRRRALWPLERWLWKGTDPPEDPGKASEILRRAERLMDTEGR